MSTPKKQRTLPDGCLKSIQEISYPGVLNGKIMDVDFGQHNLIYGWNASGKSTICRMLRSLEKGVLLNNSNFKIEKLDEASPVTLTHLDIQSHGLNLKIFNQDFIDDSIRFEDTKSLKGIVRLGSDEMQFHDKLKKLRKRDSSQFRIIKPLADVVSRTDKEIENLLKNVATEIRLATGLHQQGFNKNHTQAALNQRESDESVVLSEELLKHNSTIALSSELKAPIDEFSVLFEESIKRLLQEVSNITEKSVLPTNQIDALVNSPALEKWVHEGIGLHSDTNECLFCGNELSEARKTSFKLHYTQEVEDFKNAIQALRADLGVVAKLNPILPDTGEFYADEQESWLKLKPMIQNIFDEKQYYAATLIEALNKKESDSMFVGVVPGTSIAEELGLTNDVLDNFYKRCMALQAECDALVKSHNSRVNQHTALKDAAITSIKNHFYQLNIGEYLNISAKRSWYRRLIRRREDFSAALMRSISKLAQEIEGIHHAAEKINDRLKDFFGHDRITVGIAKIDGVESYQLKRDGLPANNLCEGEKSGIALIYFIESLENNSNTIPDSIVVMDDPISSYDSSNMYSAMTYIRTYLGAAKQLIVFTHNYSVFTELRNFFKFADKARTQKNIYQIIRRDGHSCITPASSVMENHYTEYEFLFSELTKYKETATFQDSFYLLNVARRVLEVFLTFKYGSTTSFGESTRKLFESAEQAKTLSAIEWKYVHDLINAGSHGDMDMASSKSFALSEHVGAAVTGTLKLIERIDDGHYQAMIQRAA